MLIKCIKLIVGVCMLLGILGCGGAKLVTATPDNDSGQLPRRRVVITIEPGQQDQLFAQLKKFADKQGFTLLIDTRPQGAEGFYIDMYRRDIEINGTNPFAKEEYKLGFYDVDYQNPSPESVFNDLVIDLESFISEVPGATFAVEN